MTLWRVIQSVSAALLASSALALLRQAFSPQRFNIAIGLCSAGLALAVLSGPFIGGLLVQYVHWRAIFFVNLPIGVISFALAAARAPRGTRQHTGARFDAVGSLLLALGVSAFVAGLTGAQAAGWTGVSTLLALCLSAALLLGFFWREHAAAHPMLPPALFRQGRL